MAVHFNEKYSTKEARLLFECFSIKIANRLSMIVYWRENYSGSRINPAMKFFEEREKLFYKKASRIPSKLTLIQRFVKQLKSIEDSFNRNKLDIAVDFALFDIAVRNDRFGKAEAGCFLDALLKI